MSHYARPRMGDLLEAAMEALGDPIRIAILGVLREHGPAPRSTVSEVLGIPTQTVSRHLRAMARLGVVRADPPLDEALRGQWIKYEVDDERIGEFYRELGRALGQQ